MRTVLARGSVVRGIDPKFCFYGYRSSHPKRDADGGGLRGYSFIPGVVGDPINTAGNKFVEVTDFSSQVSPLRIVRYYESTMPEVSSFGSHWRQEYDVRIEAISSTDINVHLADGKQFKFARAATSDPWTADGDINIRVQDLSGGGWRLTTAQGNVEVCVANGRLTQILSRNGMTQTLSYNRAGLLHTVADAYGHTLTFVHDAQNRVTQITDPAGHIYRYGYDDIGNLITCRLMSKPSTGG